MPTILLVTHCYRPWELSWNVQLYSQFERKGKFTFLVPLVVLNHRSSGTKVLFHIYYLQNDHSFNTKKAGLFAFGIAKGERREVPFHPYNIWFLFKCHETWQNCTSTYFTLFKIKTRLLRDLILLWQHVALFSWHKLYVMS